MKKPVFYSDEFMFSVVLPNRSECITDRAEGSDEKAQLSKEKTQLSKEKTQLSEKKTQLQQGTGVELLWLCGLNGNVSVIVFSSMSSIPRREMI